MIKGTRFFAILPNPPRAFYAVYANRTKVVKKSQVDVKKSHVIRTLFHLVWETGYQPF